MNMKLLRKRVHKKLCISEDEEEGEGEEEQEQEEGGGEVGGETSILIVNWSNLKFPHKFIERLNNLYTFACIQLYELFKLSLKSKELKYLFLGCYYACWCCF